MNGNQSETERCAVTSSYVAVKQSQVEKFMNTLQGYSYSCSSSKEEVLAALEDVKAQERR